MCKMISACTRYKFNVLYEDTQDIYGNRYRSISLIDSAYSNKACAIIFLSGVTNHSSTHKKLTLGWRHIGRCGRWVQDRGCCPRHHGSRGNRSRLTSKDRLHGSHRSSWHCMHRGGCVWWTGFARKWVRMHILNTWERLLLLRLLIWWLLELILWLLWLLWVVYQFSKRIARLSCRS